jgi:hypothetical protein
MNVAYDSIFKLYYETLGGHPSSPIYVYDETGRLLQGINLLSGGVSFDAFGLNYNPTTAQVEGYGLVNQVTGDEVLVNLERTNTGTLSGRVSTVLPALQGFPSFQSIPTLDTIHSLIYTRSGGFNIAKQVNTTPIVHITHRNDGSAGDEIVLQLPDPSDNLQNMTVAYAPEYNVLLTVDLTRNSILVNAMNGTLLGESVLPNLGPHEPTDQYGFAYANGQVFLSRNGTPVFDGFRVIAQSPTASASVQGGSTSP